MQKAALFMPMSILVVLLIKQMVNGHKPSKREKDNKGRNWQYEIENIQPKKYALSEKHLKNQDYSCLNQA